jgi:hypothetical protein
MAFGQTLLVRFYPGVRPPRRPPPQDRGQPAILWPKAIVIEHHAAGQS